MAEDNSNLDSALEGLDEDRRSTLKRLIGTEHSSHRSSCRSPWRS
jgi:hypothetical protein